MGKRLLRILAFMVKAPMLMFIQNLTGSSSGATDKFVSNLNQGNAAYNYAGNAAMDLIRGGMGTATGYLSPYLSQGTNALNAYAGLLGLPGASTTYNPAQYLQSTPGYQWQLQQGQNALDASAASRGNLLSGPQRQATQQYGQNYASNYYQQLMNQLQGLSQQGQQAGGTMGNWQMTGANELANLEMGMGQNAQNTMATGAMAQYQGSQQRNQNAMQNYLGLAGMGISTLLGSGVGNSLMQGLGTGGNALMQYLGGGGMPLSDVYGGGAGSNMAFNANSAGGWNLAP